MTRLVCPAFMIFAAAQVHGAVHRVGPGQRFGSLMECADRTRLGPGDVVEILPGSRAGGTIRWKAKGTANNPVIIRGVPDRDHRYVEIDLDEAGVNYTDRVMVFQGCEYVVLERLRLYGAKAHNFRKSGHNGERVLFVTACKNVTLRHCRVDHNLAQGVSGNGTDTLAEYCEFDHNGMTGRESSQYHNTYWGGTVTMRGCYIHDAYAPPGQDVPADRDGGQCLKSRADRIRLEYCLVVSGHNDALDLVNGHGLQVAEIIGCVLVKNTYVSNSRFCTIGGDSGTGRYRATFINTTFLQRHGGRTIDGGRGTVDLNLVNCAFGSLDGKGGYFGRGVTVTGANNYFQSGFKLRGSLIGTVRGGSLRFADADKFDFRIGAASPLVNRASLPAIPSVFGAPMLHYVHPLKTSPRPDDGRLDIGAYEFGAASVASPTGKSEVKASGKRPSLASQAAVRQKRPVDPKRVATRLASLIALAVPRVEAGARPRVYLDFLGKPTRAKLVSAGETSFRASVRGTTAEFRWDAVAPERLYGVIRKCLDENNPGHRRALAEYCSAAGLEEMLTRELIALENLNPELSAAVRAGIIAQSKITIPCAMSWSFTAPKKQGSTAAK